MSTTNTGTPTEPINLPHAEWCKAERIETTEHPDREITVTRCLDCGAHVARDRHGKTLVTPAVSGALNGEGRGSIDITMERAGGSA